MSRAPRVSVLLNAVLLATGLAMMAAPVRAQDTDTGDAGAAETAPAAGTAPSTAPAPATEAAAPAATAETAGMATETTAAGEPEGFTFSDDDWEDADSYFEDSESAIDKLLEEPTWEGPRFGLDGYYRLRWNVFDNPDFQGAANESGPKHYNYFQHRLRLMPVIGLNDSTFLKADAIVGEGLKRCGNSFRAYNTNPCDGIFGANGLTILDTQLNDDFANIEMVRFWGEVTTPIGVVRAGRQPSHWGLGLFSNDGLHEQEWGDNHFGDTYDRILFATKPLGEDSNLLVALIYDLISEGHPVLGQRGQPTLTDDSDDIHEGVLVALYQTAPLDFGIYQVARAQKNPRSRIFVSDLYGRLDIGLLYGAFEMVWLYGSTHSLPYLDQANLDFMFGDRVEVSAWNWAFEGGLRFDWYDLKLRLGNSSGDQNTTNDEPFPRIESFAFNPDYNVGLIMFEHAMANLIERKIAANFQRLALLQDQGIVTQDQVRLLGIAADLARTDGGVSNAFYVNPTAVFNPLEGLELKAGILWAQANDGIAVVGDGSNAEFEHDLGWEFDLGVEYTWREHFSVGVQGGAFLPGAVFDQPETIEDPVTGLDVPLAGTRIESDPAYLGQFRITYHIQ